MITEQNIRKIGELIALSSVRTRMIHSTRDLYYVFHKLYKDIYCHTERIILTQTAHLRQMALRRVLGYNKRAAARRDQAPVSKPDSLTKTNRNLSVKPSAENGGNRADPLAICHRYFFVGALFSKNAVQAVGVNLRYCYGIVILRTYIDRAMSGKTDKRPDFQQMLKDSARKEWDFVLVYKFDRFGRNRYETFENIYPQIVPPEIYEIVRKKVNDNKYGKTSENVEYLLKNKIICGYCGKSIVGENGTAHTGKRMYYYKCGGRKNSKNGCNKQTIRKDLLEKLVLDGMIEEMKKPGIMNGLIAELLRIQQENSKVNAAVLILQKEQKSNAAAIDNLLQAIEQGGTAASAMKRLRELESRQNDLEEQIAIENSKSEIALTEFQIRQFYEEALRNTPKMLINALVKKIILFDDKMQIIFNSPLKNAESAIMKVSPGYRGFSFAKKQIHIRYKVPQRADPVNFNFEIILTI